MRLSTFRPLVSACLLVFILSALVPGHFAARTIRGVWGSSLFAAGPPHSQLPTDVLATERGLAGRWVAAKFAARPEPALTGGSLTAKFQGSLLKNMATTKVYHSEVGALPLKIADQTFARGIYCPSAGTVVVRVPEPARSFDAVFGVDSNRVESFYSNAGQGSVVGTVEVAGHERFRSAVMREGLPGEAVHVELAGATEFTLRMTDAGNGVVERVDFNQSDWADARVTLESGQVLWLGDLPLAPRRSPYSAEPPFSFRYGSQSFRDLAGEWHVERAAREIDEERRERTLRWLDPATGLEVRCVAIEYLRFPVAEWTLFFKNTGSVPTPILSDIQPLDTRLERDSEGEFLLHHSNGSPHSLVKMSDPTDYAPRQTRLAAHARLTLGSKLGLPAANDLPFFNLQWPGSGLIVALGWPGQWTSQWQRDGERGLRWQAGQEGTHFKLLPGEEVRSPLVAILFWEGHDWIRAQNLWRRWMIRHNLPRTADGELPPPHFAASSSAYYMESTQATEANQRQFIDRYVEEQLKPDYWWIDAGWYEYQDYWLNVGTWKPDRHRFPLGLKPISDHLHQHRMKLILWFTPECAARGSAIDQEHPEWLLRGGADWWMGYDLFQGEVAGHVNDSGLTLLEDVAAFGIGNPETTVTGRTRLADGKWHLVTATRRILRERRQSELRLFVDGRLEASGESPNIDPLDANSGWGIGRQYQTRGIHGEIDDARVYDTALSAEEIALLFAHQDTRPPVSRYTFDDGLHDVVGHRDGTLIGTGEPQHVVGVTDQPGDRALQFRNDYGVEIPNTVPDDFTLSCWVRMDAPQPPPYGRGNLRLLDFGAPGCVDWLIEHVDHQIREQGVDLLRHDGIPPLGFWRANDTPDRQGISEIRHVEGLLRFWDELRRRHPQLRIDVCSGGGSRNELETLRRAVPLWRSDYAYEPTGMQTLTYGISHWIPYFGTGVLASDAYTFRSQLAPAISASWDLRPRDRDFAFCRRMMAQRSSVNDAWYGDFYPLTAYRTEDDVWMAWQFDRPDLGTGIADSIRNRRDDNLPEAIRQREVAKAFYGVVREGLASHQTDGDWKEVVADAAVRIDDAILRERIVNWTTNTDVQNRMRNDIEDALFDLKSRTGVDLSFDEIDAILEKCLDVARRRYPG